MATTKKTATKKTVVTKAPAKKLTMSIKTGKLTVKNDTKAVPAKDLEALLAAQGPFIHKAPEKSDKKADPKPAVAVKKPAPKKAEGGPTKAELARALFKKMKGKARKDVIAAFVSEGGLTLAGAATYYANIKREQE